jgi:hypothetical protein
MEESPRAREASLSHTAEGWEPRSHMAQPTLMPPISDVIGPSHGPSHGPNHGGRYADLRSDVSVESHTIKYLFTDEVRLPARVEIASLLCRQIYSLG